MPRRDWEGSWPPLVAAAAALAALWLGTGCSTDILDVDVQLQAQMYDLDFGPPRDETIPTVDCDPAAPQRCGNGMVVTVSADAGGIPAGAQVALGCDSATHRCYAQALARAAYTADVLQDDDFTTKVQRRAIGLVRVVDIAYTVPVDTLTFDLPRIDIYVGPPGTTSENDPDVSPMDSIPSIPAGQAFDDERHLRLEDASPARALVEGAIRAKQPFVVVAVAAPRLEAGTAVPAGALQLRLWPRIKLGLR